mgnify:CR=1 FL=1
MEIITRRYNRVMSDEKDLAGSDVNPDGVDYEAVWASVPAGDVALGDRVRLRKAHPCGGFDWEVVRLGADIGLVCLKCGHKVFLSRRDLQRRMKVHFPKE